jgi:hypothetical protein
MSVHAGTILHLGGRNVIDRVQSAGLGDARVPQDTIREVGNPYIVDKIPTDPSFTFTLETLDVSAEIEAWLAGYIAPNEDDGSNGVDEGVPYIAGPGNVPPAGAALAAGHEFKWNDTGFVNVISPWKDPLSGDAGNVAAGHLIPGYMPTRISYRFGVTENAATTVELAGGSYYYADGAPREQFMLGDGATTAFPTADVAIPYRRGGATGTSFKCIFGVIVNGVLQTEGVDYTQTAPPDGTPLVATVTFAVAPPVGADIRFVYFTTVAESYPRAAHADTVVKPGAVRGRHICVYLGSGGARAKVGGVQSAELTATVDGDFEREFCNEEIVGYSINGRDCNGTLGVRSKNADAFLDLVAKVTNVPRAEVQGWLNQHDLPMEIQILNPKNPAQVIKTLYVPDAQFQVPGTPARVNTPTDFSFGWESKSGTYSAFIGAMP